MVFFLIQSIKHRFFGYKEINQVRELRSELKEARGKITMLKDEAKEASEKAEKKAKELAETVKNFSPIEQPKINLQEFAQQPAETPLKKETKKSKKRGKIK